MTIIWELGRHVCALEQKFTSENINNFGQKALHAGRVIGRKMSNTLHRVESVANAAIPMHQKLQAWQGIQRHKFSRVLETVYRRSHS